MRFDIITIFPDIFDSYLNESILKRARKGSIIRVKMHTPRNFTSDKHRTVDDRPYGGGPGMILMFEPIAKTIKQVKLHTPSVASATATPLKRGKKKVKVVLLTPAGEQFTQRDAERYAKLDQLILVSGRYEGFDARIDKLVDEKISVGPYVLAGGELPALVVVEATARLIPGVLGHEHSAADETFSYGLDYIEYPQYTRPEVVDCNGKKIKVPKVLLSGNHEEIRNWRNKKVKIRKKSC